MKLHNYLNEIVRLDANLYVEGKGLFAKRPKYLSELGKKLRIPRTTLSDLYNGKSKPSLELLKKLYSKQEFKRLYLKVEFLCGKTRTNKIKLPKELSADLAYLMGAFRDGSLSSYKYEFEFSQSNKNWLIFLQKKMSKIFGIKPKIIGRRERDNCYYMRIRSKPLYRVVQVLFNYKKETWDTPAVIKSAPYKLQRYYVAGFWDAEGSISNRVITQASESRTYCEPLKFIRGVLRRDRIKSSFHKPQKTKNYFCHRLYISKTDFGKFVSKYPVKKI